MDDANAQVERVPVNVELVSTAKRIAAPIEEAYQWMIQSDTYLNPRETVCTLVFSGKGKHKINHLTWSEVMWLHQAYERLDEIEKHFKESAEQLRQSQKMEAVGTLAGGIAHDCNNLLTAINGHSHLILEGLKPDDPMHYDLSEIEKASDHAATLTRQLLAFSRKQVLQPQVIDLGKIVAEMENMLRWLIGEHIDLNVRRDPDLQMIKADPGQMDQVIMNLVLNARDAMPQGGNITMNIENVALNDQASAALGDLSAGDYVMLLISDTGVGMADDTLSHIFEPFYTTKGAEEGTGLGLSIVFGIVKQSGGGIEVESEPGTGSTFRIYLPQVDAFKPVTEEKEHLACPGDDCEKIMVLEG